jgi:hypothetical protein
MTRDVYVPERFVDETAYIKICIVDLERRMDQQPLDLRQPVEGREDLLVAGPRIWISVRINTLLDIRRKFAERVHLECV